MDKEDISHVVGVLMLLPVFGSVSALFSALKRPEPTPVSGLLMLAMLFAFASALLLTSCATTPPNAPVASVKPKPAFSVTEDHDPKEMCLTLLALACMKSEGCGHVPDASACYLESAPGCDDVVFVSTPRANECADALIADCRRELPEVCRGIGTVADRPNAPERSL